MRVLIVSSVLATLLGTAGCVSPALNVDHYQQQAVQSVAVTQSELQTTRLVLDSMLADRIFQSSADEVVSASESALSSVASSFGAVQPPAASAGIERRTTRYLSDAEDAVRQARIAVRRGDAVAMRLVVERIQRLLDRAATVTDA
ncbi:MAG: hypothetical protein ACJ73L_08820 [Actinomycetes bacterium]